MIDPAAARLVASREIREQVRGRALWISTALSVIGVVLVVVLPKVLSGGPPTYRIGVDLTATAQIRSSIASAVEATGAIPKVVTVEDKGAAAAQLRAKGADHIDIAVTTSGTDAVLVDRAFMPGTTARKALAAEAIARALSVRRAIEVTGVSPETARALTQPTPVAIEHLRPAPASNTERTVALVGAIVFFILVYRYGLGLMMGVVQEKATRIIEVILSAVRPVDLLAGKVVAFSALVLVQAALLAIAALVSAHAVGSDIVTSNSVSAIGVAFVWIVLGFLLYATLFTAVGALASKTEDAQSVSLPLQIPLLVGYFVAFTAVGNSSPNLLLKVLAYIPFTAPLDMPILAATGGASGWQVGVSMALTVAATVVTMRVGAVLFRRSVLRTGARLKLRDVLREGHPAERVAP